MIEHPVPAFHMGASRPYPRSLLIDFSKRVVIPLIIYTHKEYATQPSSKELKRMIEKHP